MEVSFYLTRSEEGKQTSVYAHIRYNGHRLKYYLTDKIDPQFWNAKEQRAKKTNRFPGYMEFNRRLGKIYDRIKDIHSAYRNNNDSQEPAPEVLRAEIDREFKDQARPAEKSFLSFFEELVKGSREGTRVQHATGKPYSKATVKSYVTALNHLKDYQVRSKKKIDFDAISVDFHSEYTEFLIKQYNLGSNSIGKDFKNIKAVLNEATERGINTNLQYKSRKFSVSKEESTSIYLSETDLQQMANLDLSGNERTDRVRDLFLIGCYTGLRYSDFSALSANDVKDGFIEIGQAKTGNKVVIPVHPVVKSILEKYAGRPPRSISNQKTNEYLKEIGKQLAFMLGHVSKTYTKGGARVVKSFEKWELLTTHTARRSFATNEYLAGTPSITIMAITGHRTEKSFLKYIKLSPTEHAQKMKDLWATRNQLKAV